MNKLLRIAKNHKNILENLSYISILQIFTLLAPFITYPYLVGVLGKELYGFVITAQVLASYCSLIIDFGSNSVCAKHVSINRSNEDKLSEIVSSVFYIRSGLWVICLFFYIGLIYLIPSYRPHFFLFLFSYGMTMNEVLFPQYFFQGIERMKYSTLINILIKIVFIALVFIVVKSESDYLYVPLLYATGYVIGGIVALSMIFGRMQIRLTPPNFDTMKFYIKDCSAILATDLICTIKDKLNYLLVGSFAGMGNVVIYDLGSKINSLLYKPTEIVRTVLLPHFAKNKNLKQFKIAVIITASVAVILTCLANIFLPQIVEFFLHEEIALWPVRLFTLAPVILSVSAMISNNAFIAWGYNKYVLYSIIITTLVYIVTLVIIYFSGLIDRLYSFVLIAIISFLAELLYRLFALRKVIKDVQSRTQYN